MKEQELRNHLGSFGIKGGLATAPMRSLSGGQAVRVGLAAVASTAPHLLVLASSPSLTLKKSSTDHAQQIVSGSLIHCRIMCSYHAAIC
ncbi:hypothetical protein, partial [Streptomyces scabiei]|uniref:hypothetical protein n=1 Tax=Streptomyces scabiei TaxID=1930 RepID=UPI0038F72EF2